MFGTALRVLAAAAIAATAMAQSPPFELRPYIAPYARNGPILALRLSIENPGATAAAWDLTLDQDTTSPGEVHLSHLALGLPPHARKQMLVYAATPNPLRRITATLSDRHGRVVSKSVIEPEWVPLTAAVVAVMSQEPVGLAALKLEQAHPAYAVQVTPPYPDSWLAWNSADVVVWPDPEPALFTAEENDALLAWVEAGGTLIVATPRGRAPLAQSALAAALPAEVGDAVATDAVRGVIDTPVARTHLAQVRGEVVIGPEADPACVVGRHGLGRIALVPFDLRAEAFVRSPASPRFWKTLLAGIRHRPSSLRIGQAGWGSVAMLLDQTVTTMPGVRLRSVGLVSALLVLYLIAIGPLDFLVLRRLKRRTWTWFTYPALVLAFSVAILAVSFASRSPGARLSTVTVRDWRDGVESGTVIAGLSSERRGRLELALNEPGWRLIEATSGAGYEDLVIRSSAGLSRVQGMLGATLDQASFQVEAWQAPLVHGRRLTHAPPAFELNRNGGSFSVVSRLAYAVDDLYLVAGGLAWHAGPLGAGATIKAGPSARLHDVISTRAELGDLARSHLKLAQLAPALASASVASELDAILAAQSPTGQVAPEPADADREPAPWLDIPAAERAGCVLLIAFSSAAPLPVTTSGAFTADSLLVLRQLSCGDQP